MGEGFPGCQDSSAILPAFDSHAHGARRRGSEQRGTLSCAADSGACDDAGGGFRLLGGCLQHPEADLCGGLPAGRRCRGNDGGIPSERLEDRRACASVDGEIESSGTRQTGLASAGRSANLQSNNKIKAMSEQTANEAAKKLESSAAHAKKAIEAATEAGKAVGETVKKHAQTVVETGKTHLGAAAKDISDAAAAKYGEIKDQAAHVAGDYRSKAQNLQGDVEGYVKENPLRALGIAVGVGFILGVLIRR